MSKTTLNNQLAYRRPPELKIGLITILILTCLTLVVGAISIYRGINDPGWDSGGPYPCGL